MLMLVPRSLRAWARANIGIISGAMVNRGVEINVNGDVFRTKTSSGIERQRSYNRNKLTELYGGVTGIRSIRRRG